MSAITWYSAKDQRPEGVKFYVRRQVEVLSGILVDLKRNKKVSLKEYLTKSNT